MRVFISWSGITSLKVANALYGWLPTVVPAIEPWLSPVDINRGATWIVELRRKLQRCSFGIVCVTEDNLGAPWLLFESGALAKSLERSFVCPYIFKLTPNQIVGPLSQFQLTKANEVETKLLLQTINRALGKTSISKNKLEANFIRQWPILHDTLRRIARQHSRRLEGKRWVNRIKEGIRYYLHEHSGDSRILTIRLLSYTGETTSLVLTRLISKHVRHPTDLKIKILLRSEYDAFTGRTEAQQFNQHIRRRITMAKAEWYKWLREYKESHKNLPNVDLEIRGYPWDPTPKALILGDSEASFGLYTTGRHSLSCHKHIAQAKDWIAAETDMAHIDSRNQRFLNNLIDWFDQAWKKSTGRITEAYRYKVSDCLWELGTEKLKMDEHVKRLFCDWTTTDRIPEIRNLALPSYFPENASGIIDFMACAVVLNSTPERCVLICEVRHPGEDWEGIGKTSTYLEFIGIKPRINLNTKDFVTGNEFFSKLKELDQTDRSLNWDIKKADACLFAADFVWLWEEDGELHITRPEGEVFWGLWDCSRYLLRNSLPNYRPGDQRDSPGRDIQKEIFLKLPFKELAKRYYKKSRLKPCVIIILCPGNNGKNIQKVRNEDKIAWLLKAIQSAPHHPSTFWNGDADEIARHNKQAQQILKVNQFGLNKMGLDPKKLPEVYIISGAIPFGPIAKIIKDRILKSSMQGGR